MLATKLVQPLRLLRVCGCKMAQSTRTFSAPKDKEDNPKLGDFSSKYKVFKDEDSEMIVDIYEERLKYADLEEQAEVAEDIFQGISLERGINGVFEIEELVEVLERENGMNIFVAAVPPDIKYVDYMCMVTGKSQKHMKAIAQFVRRVYKQKKCETDRVPTIEGVDSQDWIAMDLGNIALHVFSHSARERYDLDSLWAVGPKFDKEYNKQDPIVEMLERHSIYLKDLVPAK